MWISNSWSFLRVSSPKKTLRSLQTVFRAPDFKVKLDIDFQKHLDEMTSWHPSPGGGEVSRRFTWSDGSERYHPPEVVGMGFFFKGDKYGTQNLYQLVVSAYGQKKVLKLADFFLEVLEKMLA